MIKIDVEKINNWDIIKEKYSEWYKEKILPNIEKTCEFLKSKEDKNDSMKEYLDELEKIKEEKKDFQEEKNLIKI